MKHTTWIAFAVALLVAVAGAVAWRLRTAQLAQSASASAESVAAPGAKVFNAERSVGTPPPAKAGMPKHLRRLLATRLGRPRVLRLQRVRTVRNPQYAGVACGEVAWGDTPAQASEFKRFVASKRTVHVDGAADFEGIWNKVCARR